MLEAAGGTTRADMRFPLRSNALKREVEPYVLASTPAVLSLGRRCMMHGYSFEWPAYGHPIFKDSQNRIIPLEVNGFIPYIREHGKRPCSRKAVPGPTAVGKDEDSLDEGKSVLARWPAEAPTLCLRTIK